MPKALTRRAMSSSVSGEAFLRPGAGVSRATPLGGWLRGTIISLRRRALGSASWEGCRANPVSWGAARCPYDKKSLAGFQRGHSSLAPRVGLEPTTTRLTAAGSTIELSRNSVVRSACFAPCERGLVYRSCGRVQPEILTNFGVLGLFAPPEVVDRSVFAGKRPIGVN